jgi:multimeric flavodoxin WrbA
MAKAKHAKAAKKVVILLGSPRKNGNSALLAREIAAGAKAAGASAESLFLHGLKIAPCSACEACHQPDAAGCVIRDDMQQIYPKLKAADAIVYASPIYWFTISAQLKLAIDRCYSLISPQGHAFKGKRIGLAFAYGGEDPYDSGCTNAIRMFQDAFGFIGAEIVGMVYASAGAAGDIQSNKKVMEEARDLGRKLVAG